jgi:hypothetical protein
VAGAVLQPAITVKLFVGEASVREMSAHKGFKACRPCCPVVALLVSPSPSLGNSPLLSQRFLGLFSFSAMG